MSDLWIFGYGSLIWRPGFAFRERRAAFLDGWVRRFWQGSTDHRGLPGAPGRVVTLVREAGGVCGGVAFRVASGDRDATLAALDHRERGGFARRSVEVRFADGGVTRVVTWVAGPGNPNYLGRASARAIARQVRSASGPSGDNFEYVLRLADSLGALGLVDPHVERIAALVADPGPS